jgi:hypothetical protein
MEAFGDVLRHAKENTEMPIRLGEPIAHRFPRQHRLPVMRFATFTPTSARGERDGG